MSQLHRGLALVIAGVVLAAQPIHAAAQSGTKPPPDKPPGATAPTNGVPAVPPVPAAPTVPGGIVPPPGYVIGTDDVLSIVFWREKDLSAEVVVRPDGKISLPLLDEIDVVGLTPAELREKVMLEANKIVEDANATVVVKQINSRRVFITGSVNKPGVYQLTGPMTVVQLIAVAGGLLEFADGDKIKVMRTEKAAPVAFPFNYKRFSEGKNLDQNILLKPGDTVIVP
jgi:polysaccharide export outer membrane protein